MNVVVRNYDLSYYVLLIIEVPSAASTVIQNGIN